MEEGTRTSPSDMDDESCVRERVEEIIRADNKEEFISFLRSGKQKSGLISSPIELLSLTCFHSAVGCATALLEGKTGLYVAANDAPEGEGEMYPLQLAATNLSWGLTVTLLKEGANANLFDTDKDTTNPNLCDTGKDGSKDIATLPLTMALKALCDRYVTDWTPDKSIYKLLYIFCLPNLKEPLEIIKLLADRTENVEEISLYCVEKEQVIQLAALLLVAWDKLMPPSIKKAEESTIGERIWGQIGTNMSEELQFMINCGVKCEVVERLKTKKINLVAEWKILKILEKARPVIEEYRHNGRVKEVRNHEVPFDVAYMLSQCPDLVLTPDDMYSDDIECLRPKLEAVNKAKLNEDLESCMSSWSMTPKLKTEDEGAEKEFLQKKQLLEPVLSSAGVRKPQKGWCSMTSTNCSSLFRSYHTCGASIVGFGTPIKNLLPRNSLLRARASSFSILLPAARLLLNATRRVK